MAPAAHNDCRKTTVTSDKSSPALVSSTTGYHVRQPSSSISTTHDSRRTSLTLPPPLPAPRHCQEENFPTESEMVVAEALLLLSKNIPSMIVIRPESFDSSAVPVHPTVQMEFAASAVDPMEVQNNNVAPLCTGSLAASSAPVHDPTDPMESNVVDPTVAHNNDALLVIESSASPAEVHPTDVQINDNRLRTESATLHPTVVQNMDTKLHRCNLCGATFSSGQALGGHKTFHRPKAPPVARNPFAASTLSNDTSSSANGQFQYRCFVCGEVFPSGQALGGHKRKHYEGDLSRNGDGKKRGKICRDFDLNLPPLPESDEDAN